MTIFDESRGTRLRMILPFLFLNLYFGNSDFQKNSADNDLNDSSVFIDGWSIKRWREVSLNRKGNPNILVRQGMRAKKAKQAFTVRWPLNYSPLKTDDDKCRGTKLEGTNSSVFARSEVARAVRRPSGSQSSKFCRCPWFQIEYPGSGAYQTDNTTVLRYSSGGWGSDRRHPRRGPGSTAGGVAVHCELYGPLHAGAAARKESVFPLDLSEEWEGEDVVTLLSLPLQQGAPVSPFPTPIATA